MRTLYVLLMRLLVPFVVAHDAWQGLRDRDQRGRLRQRLGYVERAGRTGAIWIHAVSVGEVQAAAALVRALQRRHPAQQIIILRGAVRALHVLFQSLHSFGIFRQMPHQRLDASTVTV